VCEVVKISLYIDISSANFINELNANRSLYDLTCEVCCFYLIFVFLTQCSLPFITLNTLDLLRKDGDSLLLKWKKEEKNLQ